MVFSLPKLIALAGVIWAVWLGFRLLERRGGFGTNTQKSEDEKAKDPHGALDLVECKSCKSWVVASEIDNDICERCVEVE